MDVLIRYGFSITEIKNMMDTNPDIESTPDKSIYEIIEILNSIGCLSNHIKNIFYSNPYCLSKKPQDIKRVIDKLYDLNLTHLEVLIDTNPYLLNISSKEIQKAYKQKEKENLKEEEIKEFFYYHSDELI